MLKYVMLALISGLASSTASIHNHAMRMAQEESVSQEGGEEKKEGGVPQKKEGLAQMRNKQKGGKNQGGKKEGKLA